MTESRFRWAVVLLLSAFLIVDVAQAMPNSTNQQVPQGGTAAPAADLSLPGLVECSSGRLTPLHPNKGGGLSGGSQYTGGCIPIVMISQDPASTTQTVHIDNWPATQAAPAVNWPTSMHCNTSDLLGTIDCTFR